MEAGRFTIVERDTDASLVHLEGEFDDVDDLARVLSDLAGRSKAVRLDMEAVTFFGSRGLATLIAARRVALDHGGGLRVIAASPQVMRLLDITDFHSLLGPVSGDRSDSRGPDHDAHD